MNINQAVIICGGLATRLGRKTKEIPKSLLKINRKPFLYYQLKYLEKNNIENVVLCTGNLHEKIFQFINQNKKKFNLNIFFSVEKKKLGTGGCIKNAINKLNDNFFVMYGDSYLRLDLYKMQKIYNLRKKKCLISIYKNNNIFYENNIFIKNNKIAEYDKKNKSYMKYIDYGVLIFEKNFFIKSSKNLRVFDLLIILKESIKKDLISFISVDHTFFEIGSHKGINDLKNYLSKSSIRYEN